MNGKLSIIIPVYNTEPYLYKSLSAIVNQTYQNLEIIIIDDGSTDHSEQIYTNFAAEDSRIIIYKEPNLGLSYARNTGLAFASGEYITFCDSYDWIDTKAYEEMITLLEDTKSDIAVCGYVNENDDHRFVPAYYNVTKTETKTALVFLEDMLLYHNTGFVCNKIFRRRLIIRDNILFNTNLRALEDFNFVVKICQLNPLFVCTEKAFYHYYVRSDSLSKAAVSDNKFAAYYGSELVLKEIKQNFPEVFNQAAAFFYNTNVELLNEIYHSKPINEYYLKVVRAGIKNVGLLNRVNIKIRIKVRFILNFPILFGLIKKIVHL